MTVKLLKRAARVLAVLLLLSLIALAVGPFLIPVPPLEGLGSAQQAAVAESNFITLPFAGTDGIDIHYIADGPTTTDDEPTFVLLHGSVFNAFTWNEVMDFFAGRGRVIAYDQIPYGLSEKLLAGDWTEHNPYSATAAVEQLFLFLDALEADQVVLVGNSYGGVLAVQAALAHPERVEALILVDAAVYIQESLPAWLMELPQVQHLGPLFAREIGRSETFIRQTYRDPERINAERMAYTIIHTEVENWDLAFWEYLQAWGSTSPDFTDRIAEIAQPVLVISGDSDAIVPVADSERLANELPEATLTILPACGHVPQEECPESFEEAVADWLGQTLIWRADPPADRFRVAQQIALGRR